MGKAYEMTPKTLGWTDNMRKDLFLNFHRCAAHREIIYGALVGMFSASSDRVKLTCIRSLQNKGKNVESKSQMQQKLEIAILKKSE